MKGDITGKRKRPKEPLSVQISTEALGADRPSSALATLSDSGHDRHEIDRTVAAQLLHTTRMRGVGGAWKVVVHWDQ